MPHSSREGSVCRPRGPDLVGSKQLLMLSNCIFCAEEPIVICKYWFLVCVYDLLHCLIAAKCHILQNWTGHSFLDKGI